LALQLYLAPHLDDAVLSCGGLIHRQVEAGDQVLVLTVFAGDPEPGIRSSFVEFLVQVWQAPQDNPVPMRRAEDLAATALLGAAALHWPYADCIFRHHPASGEPLYPTRESIYGEVHPVERTVLVGELARRLEAFCRERQPATVYSLLTAGHHVDHQIVQQASRHLESAGWAVRYYEDYPYVEDPSCLEAALKAAGGAWQAELEALSPADLEARIAAVACYTSQLAGLFGGEEEMKQRLRAYAGSLAGDGPAERYWRPVGAGG